MILLFILNLFFSFISSSTIYTYSDYIQKAEQMIKINNAKKAIEPLKAAIELQKDTVDAYNTLGWAYLSMKQYKKAEHILKIAIEKKITIADTQYYLAVAYAKQGSEYYERAISAFKSALELSPEHYGAMLNLANLYRTIKKNQMAEAMYKQVLIKFPNDFEANYQLALIYSVNSDKTEAIKYMKKALELKPNDMVIKKRLQDLDSLKNNVNSGD